LIDLFSFLGYALYLASRNRAYPIQVFYKAFIRVIVSYWSPSLTLFFPDLPKPPVDVIAVEVTSDSVTLSWDSGNDDVTESYIIRYKLASSSGDDSYVQVTDVTDSEYTLTELVPHSAYEFHLMAVNSIGMSAPSEKIEVTTKESGEPLID